jgi:peptide/nickel transport system substrate-binding protein
MLANFASTWNCIYSAAKLVQDPEFPKTHVLGTGAFSFVEYAKGQYWRGRRWDRYFLPGRPYLDGYQADFMPTMAVMAAYKSGHIAAEFRGVTPPQRDDLAETLGDRIETSESPWLSNLLVVFNTKRPPFGDVRVRRAFSLAIDRWGCRCQAANLDLHGICRRGDAPGLEHGRPRSRAGENTRLLARHRRFA